MGRCDKQFVYKFGIHITGWLIHMSISRLKINQIYQIGADEARQLVIDYYGCATGIFKDEDDKFHDNPLCHMHDIIKLWIHMKFRWDIVK